MGNHGNGRNSGAKDDSPGNCPNGSSNYHRNGRNSGAKDGCPGGANYLSAYCHAASCRNLRSPNTTIRSSNDDNGSSNDINGSSNDYNADDEHGNANDWLRYWIPWW